MSVLRKKVEFYKGTNDCEAIVIAVLDLGQSPGGISGGEIPQNIGFLMSLKQLNDLQ